MPSVLINRRVILAGNRITTAPTTPTGLAAFPGDGEVTLDWNVSIGATGYKIYRGGVFLANAGEGVTEIVNTPVTNGVTYSYTISATNAGGESAQSDATTATPDSGGDTYLRPGGSFTYLRPGGVDQYLRP